MIKYELTRKQENIGNFLMLGFDTKTVHKIELNNHLKDGWLLVRKKYFIVTNILDFWKGLKFENKLGLISLLVGILSVIIAVFN